MNMKFNPREISINPLEDLFSFAWAELLIEPFDRISAVFRIVATINTMAERDDIVRRIASAFGQWYPMILSYFMPKPLRSSADGATASEVFKTTLPVGDSKSYRKCALTGSSSLRTQSPFFWIVLSISTLLSLMSAMIYPRVSPFLFSVFLIPLTISALIFLRIVSTRCFGVLQDDLSSYWIAFSSLFSTSFAMFSLPLYALLITIFGMCLIPGVSFLVVAFSTFATQTVRRVFPSQEISRSRQIFVAAYNTRFEGVRLEDHSAPLSLHHMMLLENGVICRFVGRPSLSSNVHYIRFGGKDQAYA